MLLMLLWQLAGVAAENGTKLLVVVTIDRFYPEWLSIYSGDMDEGGFRRIVRQGTMTMADYDCLYSQTGMDMATMYTGVLPAVHGIVAHDWYDRLKHTRENNAMAGSGREIGGDGGLGYSPERLRTTTLGCALKMNDSFSKVYSIAADPEVAVMAGGSCANLALWMSEKSGKWVSSEFYADSLPRWLSEYNAKMTADEYIRKGWMPLSEEQSNPLSLKVKSKLGWGNSFFYDIAQTKRNYNTYRVLKATPYVNAMAVDVAEQVVSNEGLGKDNDVDLLSIGLSSLDYMNRDFAVSAKEFQDLVLRMDRDIRHLLDFLDERVGKENYTLVLAFTEARELLPEEMEKWRVESGYFSIFKSVALLKSYLNLLYGDGEWVVDYDAGQIYLNRDLIERSKLSLRDMQDNVADFMIEFEGVTRVLTAYSLSRNDFSHGQELLMQNAFYPKRSGDVMFCLHPSWISDLKDKEDGYFRYSKRNKVPVYFIGAGVAGRMAGECRMTDLLPTFCRLTGVPVPYTAVGTPLFGEFSD